MLTWVTWLNGACQIFPLYSHSPPCPFPFCPLWKEINWAQPTLIRWGVIRTSMRAEHAFVFIITKSKPSLRDEEDHHMPVEQKPRTCEAQLELEVWQRPTTPTILQEVHSLSVQVQGSAWLQKRKTLKNKNKNWAQKRDRGSSRWDNFPRCWFLFSPHPFWKLRALPHWVVLPLWGLGQVTWPHM